MTDNPHTGSSFDDFLQEKGLYEKCSAIAIKRVLARQIEAEIKRQNRTSLSEIIKLERKPPDWTSRSFPK